MFRRGPNDDAVRSRPRPTRRAGRFAVPLGSLAALALVASSCLGPGQFDPTGRAPVGSLDVVRDEGGSIRVAGWAIDPDTGAPVVVKVGAEGVVHDVLASQIRPDVGAAFPFHGAAHGFDYAYGYLPPGLHGICVWVPNAAGRGDDRLLGCKNVQVGSPDPGGRLDGVSSPAPRRIDVWGSAYDPNPGTVQVDVTVDGAMARRVDTAGSGWSTSLEVQPGVRTVCATVLNVSWGSNLSLGCRTVSVADRPDRRPAGALSEVTPLGGGSVRIAGSASDPDGAAGLSVRVVVDAGGGPGTVVLPVSAGRFGTTLTGLADGAHSICPTGLDVPSPPGTDAYIGDRAFACGTAVLDSTGGDSLGTPGVAAAGPAVGPPAGHPLAGIERDGGVSVTLGDGNVMWFFGDSAQRDAGGSLMYFVNNTAALAAGASPTVTRDHVDPGPRPRPFVVPPTNFCTAPGDLPTPALWPEAAVVIPQGGGVDRVVVFVDKVCLGPSFLAITPKGMAVTETTYVAGQPLDSALEGTGLTDIAGIQPAWGTAAAYDGSNVMLYQCDRPASPGLPADYGPCRVARTGAGHEAEPSTWRYWNGGDWHNAASWVSNPAAAATMATPPGASGQRDDPIAAFTVAFDSVLQRWVMTYSPWPGFTTAAHIRVSRSPVGPWSAPLAVELPGCGGDANWCYAATAQPRLGRSGAVGIGWLDMSAEGTPGRSAYMSGTAVLALRG